MTSTRVITLGRWVNGEKSGKWSTISDLTDDDLLAYICGTKAQIKMRQRGLTAAEEEAQKRGLTYKKENL